MKMSNLNLKQVTEAKTTGQMPQLYVGMELESSLQESAALARFMKDKFNIDRCEHSNGMEGRASNSVRVGDATVSINIPGACRYDRPGLVAEYYMDGSVGIEVVTRPVLTDKISVIKTGVFEPLKAFGADYVANGKAGLHLTFLTDHHKSLSVFNRLWVRNIQQLTRFFYQDIINWRFSDSDTKTRALGYRKLFGREEVMDNRSQHYSAISLRFDDNYNVWGVEVRVPDGTNDWSQVEAYVKFWRAFFELAFDMAKTGMVEFSQDIWNTNSSWASEKYSEWTRGLYNKGKGKNKLVLTKLLTPYMKDPLPTSHIMTWVEWYNKQQGTTSSNSASVAEPGAATTITRGA
jgi:hypothetical protein